jgi:ribosomal protein S11
MAQKVVKATTTKKKKANVSPKVMVKIKATYNNTIITITDYQGNAISTSRI